MPDEPSAERKAPSADLQSPLFRAIGYPFWRGLARVLLFFLGPMRVVGKYRVPKQGGVIVLANHQSDIDPIAAACACSRTVYFMAKSELFEMKVVGPMIRWFRAFPVKRGEPDKTAIKKAVAYLHAGQVVCVFPEGELSEDGEIQPLKPGVALIVRMSGAQVICLGLKNTRKIMPCGSLLPRPAFGGVAAIWGEPRSFDRKAEAGEILGWAEVQLRELTS